MRALFPTCVNAVERHRLPGRCGARRAWTGVTPPGGAPHRRV